MQGICHPIYKHIHNGTKEMLKPRSYLRIHVFTIFK